MKFLTNEGIKEKEYEEQIKSLSGLYPKRFLDIFKEFHGFHDYLILSFKYLADTSIFKEKSDKFELTLESDIDYDRQRLTLQFDHLQSIDVKFSDELYNMVWSSPREFSGMLSIGRVYYIELGVDQNNNFTFEMLTEEGVLLTLVFKKVKIAERKLIRWVY